MTNTYNINYFLIRTFNLFLILFSLFNYNCSDSKNKIINHKNSNLEALANDAYNKNDYEKAISLFDSLIANDSTRGELYYKRGYSHMMKKNTIIQDSLLSIKSRNDFSKLEEEKFSNAIKDNLKAITLGYKKPQAYLSLGVMYTFINDSIALGYFTKSLHEDPNYKKAKYEIELCNERIKSNQHFY